MELHPICVRDCKSACCIASKYLPFTPAEASMLINAGSHLHEAVRQNETLSAERKTYIKTGACTLLEDNGKCSIFKSSKRHQICQEFKEGSKDCLRFRAENPAMVIQLTSADVEFQNWYFGYDDSC